METVTSPGEMEKKNRKLAEILLAIMTLLVLVAIVSIVTLN